MTSRAPRAALRRVAATSPALVTCLLSTAFAGWFAWLTLERHAALGTNAEDLGFHTQTVWNTLQGQPFRLSLYEDMVVHTDIDPATLRRPDSLLAFHVEPLLLPISLLFRWWPGAETLLVIQAVAAAAGAWPIHRLAVRSFSGGFAGWWVRFRRLGRGAAETGPGANPASREDRAVVWAGPVFAAVYLLAPPLHWALLSDFHTTVIAAAALAFLYDFALPDHKPRYRPGRIGRLADALRATDAGFWIAGLIAVSAREELGLLVAPIAAYRLIRGPRRAAGAALAVVAIAWVGACALIILPAYGPLVAESGGSSPFLNRYGHLGQTPAAILESLLTRPDLVTGLIGRPPVAHSLLGLVALAGGLWLFAPIALVPAVPIVLLNVLSAWPWMAAGQAHYSVLIVPSLVAGSCLGGGLIAGVLRGRRLPGHHLIAVWALVAALLWSRSEGLTPLNQAYHPPVPSPHDRLLKLLIDQIPPDAAVSASTAIYPHLAARSAIYLYPTVRDAEYILVDVTGSSFPTSPGDQYLRLKDLLNDGTFGILVGRDGYLLLGRSVDRSAPPEEFWTFLLPGGRGPGPSYAAGLVPAALRWEVASDGPTEVIRISIEWIAGRPDAINELPIARANLAGDRRDLAAEAPGLWWLRSREVAPGELLTITFPALPRRGLESIEVGPPGGPTRQIVIPDHSPAGEIRLQPAEIQPTQ